MMRLLFLAICIGATSCAANAASDDLPDTAGDIGSGGSDMKGDQATNPSATIAIELGPRDLPFEPWVAGGDVIVIQGPQGGFHTEHRAQVTGAASPDELHLAIIYGEVWRDDLVLARAGWEFWDDQWEPTDGGYEVELPALIFDDRPDFGPAELRASLELTDGRTVDYALPIELVDIP